MALTGKSKEQTATSEDYHLLRRPVITEKSSIVGIGNTVVFRVDPRASKPEIQRAVERVFKVEVDKVRTLNFIGKLKRTARQVGRQAKYKKAYVTLKAGHTIDLVEGL